MPHSSLHGNPKAMQCGYRLLFPVAVLAFVCLLFALPAAAQFDTGTIAGSVTDSSGAVVPNATVIVTNVQTGFKKTLPSDGGGNYTVVDLSAEGRGRLIDFYHDEDEHRSAGRGVKEWIGELAESMQDGSYEVI